VPFKPLMPLVDVYVTNGGFGGVQYALTNGLPIVTAGTTEDNGRDRQPCRVQRNRDQPQDQLSAARGDCRGREDDPHEPVLPSRAKAVQLEMAERDGPAEAAVLLNRLSELRKPILRRTCKHHSRPNAGLKRLVIDPGAQHPLLVRASSRRRPAAEPAIVTAATICDSRRRGQSAGAEPEERRDRRPVAAASRGPMSPSRVRFACRVLAPPQAPAGPAEPRQARSPG
jgi:hypothetical protein